MPTAPGSKPTEKSMSLSSGGGTLVADWNVGGASDCTDDLIVDEVLPRVNSLAYSISPGGKFAVAPTAKPSLPPLRALTDDEASACSTAEPTTRALAAVHLHYALQDSAATQAPLCTNRSFREGHLKGEGQNYALADENFISLLMAVDGNHRCADCGDTARVTWASWVVGRDEASGAAGHHGHGIVLCSECCGGHRSLGVHISQPFSIKMDEWSHEMQVKMLKSGNSRSNAIFECHASHASHKPLPSTPLDAKHAYIRAKYTDRVWCNVGAGIPNCSTSLVPSKQAPQQAHAGICIVKVMQGKWMPGGEQLLIEVSHSNKSARTAPKKVGKGALVWNETLRLNVGIDSESLPLAVSLRHKSKKAKPPLGTVCVDLAAHGCNELKKVTLCFESAGEVDVEILWCPLDA